jgi:hypothetical protein
MATEEGQIDRQSALEDIGDSRADLPIGTPGGTTATPGNLIPPREGQALGQGADGH